MKNLLNDPEARLPDRGSHVRLVVIRLSDGRRLRYVKTLGGKIITDVSSEAQAAALCQQYGWTL